MPVSGAAGPRRPAGCSGTATSWHADGSIVDARIVPPTSQNQPAIEHDLRHLIEDSLALDDQALEALCEQAVRNYDPCISCATHFLDIRVVRT